MTLTTSTPAWSPDRVATKKIVVPRSYRPLGLLEDGTPADIRLDPLQDRGNGVFDRQYRGRGGRNRGRNRGHIRLREISWGGVPGTYPALVVVASCPDAASAWVPVLKAVAEDMKLMRILIFYLISDPRPPAAWDRTSAGDLREAGEILRGCLGYGAEVVCGFHLPPETAAAAADVCAAAECQAADIVISERGHSGLLVWARDGVPVLAPSWPRGPVTAEWGLYPWSLAGRWWGRRVGLVPGSPATTWTSPEWSPLFPPQPPDRGPGRRPKTPKEWAAQAPATARKEAARRRQRLRRPWAGPGPQGPKRKT